METLESKYIEDPDCCPACGNSLILVEMPYEEIEAFCENCDGLVDGA